jgi:hypothetical protein
LYKFPATTYPPPPPPLSSRHSLRHEV